MNPGAAGYPRSSLNLAGAKSPGPLFDQLQLFPDAPTGVPADVWALFVREADKVRASGRTHYGARTILEYIRHHEVFERGNAEFKLNNNIQAQIARAYMRLRGCYGFFEIRDRHSEVA